MSKTAISSTLLLVASLLFLPVLVQAELVESMEGTLSLGYRVDQFDWNISGNYQGEDPNILSELTWEDLEIVQLQLDLALTSRQLSWLGNSRLQLAGNLAYGSIFAGENQDSDYAADDRTEEWSRSNNGAEDGSSIDVGGAFGPEFQLLQGKIILLPLLGYSLHIQDLSITDGYQTLAPNPLQVGPISGLDSSYCAYWYGPWMGARIQVAPSPSWKLEVRGEYHLVEYFAEADWNLRDDLEHPVSFEHEADGYGTVFGVQSFHQLNPHWSLLFSGTVQSWLAEDGTDITFREDGSRSRTRLNEVNWESISVSFGAYYRF